MAKLVHIESSPRKERSHSIHLAKVFLETYAHTHPGDTIETLDVWSMPLPEFDGDALEAKYAVMRSATHTPAQATAWERVTATFRRLEAADKLLFSVPMWNFGIPYALKHFIDVVTQPGLAFRVTPDGRYEGLLSGRPAVAIYARGSTYAPGSPAAAFDLQKPYLEQWLGFIGITEVHAVSVEPTVGGSPEERDSARAAAEAEVRRIAETL